LTWVKESLSVSLLFATTDYLKEAGLNVRFEVLDWGALVAHRIKSSWQTVAGCQSPRPPGVRMPRAFMVQVIARNGEAPGVSGRHWPGAGITCDKGLHGARPAPIIPLDGARSRALSG
jgi:hypothetical protein